MRSEQILNLAEAIVAQEFPLSLDAFRVHAPDVMDAIDGGEMEENSYLVKFANPSPQAEFGMAPAVADSMTIVGTVATVTQLALMLIQISREARRVNQAHKLIGQASKDLEHSLSEAFGPNKAQSIARQFEHHLTSRLDG